MNIIDRLHLIKALLDQLDLNQDIEETERHLLETKVVAFRHRCVLATARRKLPGLNDAYPTLAEERAWAILEVTRKLPVLKDFACELATILTAGLSREEIEEIGLGKIIPEKEAN